MVEAKKRLISVPQSSAPRQLFLDALRGFALWGILLVNIAVFASPYYGSGLTSPMAISAGDWLVTFIVAAFFETKFYLLFSFLFGYSFTIQMMSAQRRQASFFTSFMRRLLGLAVIGALHAVFLYHGDILTTYALVGVVLYSMRARSERFLLGLVLSLIMATAAWWLFLAFQREGIQMTEAAQLAELAELAAITVGFQGGMASVIEQHVLALKSVWIITWMMQGPMALAMFGLGLIAGRRQVFLHLAQYARCFKRLRFWGLMVGMPIAVLYGYSSTYHPGSRLEMVSLALSVLTGPALSMAYMALAVAVYQSRWGTVITEWLAPAGKMALSNYVLQSLWCSLIFYGIGLGLIGQCAPTTIFWLACALFLGQTALSHYWLRHYAYGPLEWCLRMWTNGCYVRLRQKTEPKVLR